MATSTGDQRAQRDQQRITSEEATDRPYLGSGLMIVAGALVLLVTYQFTLELMLMGGLFTAVGFVWGALMVGTGVLALADPRLSTAAGIGGIAFSILSILGALGGMLVGIVVGIVGGSLLISWQPESEAVESSPTPATVGQTTTAGQQRSFGWQRDQGLEEESTPEITAESTEETTTAEPSTSEPSTSPSEPADSSGGAAAGGPASFSWQEDEGTSGVAWQDDEGASGADEPAPTPTTELGETDETSDTSDFGGSPTDRAGGTSFSWQGGGSGSSGYDPEVAEDEVESSSPFDDEGTDEENEGESFSWQEDPQARDEDE